MLDKKKVCYKCARTKSENMRREQESLTFAIVIFLNQEKSNLKDNTH